MLLLQDVFGTGAFEIRLESIQNINGVLLNGSCCDGFRTMSYHQLRCMEECDTYFRICLKQYEDVVSTSGPCTVGNATTPVLGNNSFQIPVGTMSADGRKFSNPIILPFTVSWMVSS